MFSLLLIIAFLCANLPAKIQAFPSYCKHCFATSGNNRQKNLCGIVRLCGNCAVTIPGVNLCGIVRAHVNPASRRKAPQRPSVRDLGGWWRVWSRGAGRQAASVWPV